MRRTPQLSDLDHLTTAPVVTKTGTGTFFTKMLALVLGAGGGLVLLFGGAMVTHGGWGPVSAWALLAGLATTIVSVVLALIVRSIRRNPAVPELVRLSLRDRRLLADENQTLAV